MTFTTTGTMYGRERAVTWADGQLSGDPVAVAAITGLMASGELVSLAGVWYGAAGTANAMQALATMVTAFDAHPQLTGDVPEPEQLPPGAVP